MDSRYRWRIACFALFCNAGITTAHSTDWLQFGFGPAHVGVNPEELGFSTSGNTLVFPPVALPSGTDMAPIFVGAVVTDAGARDLLIIETKNGTVAALDAGSGNLIWSAQVLGAGFSTGSPAVDTARQFVYAYALDGKVHKYQIDNGQEVLASGWPQVSTLKPTADRGSAGITIAAAGDGSVYLYSVTSSYYDTDDYQGHLTTVNLSSGAQTVFNAQCSNLAFHFVRNGITGGSGQDDCTLIPSTLEGQTANSGIWGRAGAVYDVGTNRVFISTGNGLFDPQDDLGNGMDWADTVLALNPDGTGSNPAKKGLPLDNYTPVNDVDLYENDADLGSTSLAILPAPAGSIVAHLGLHGGKDGCIRLLNIASLNGTQTPGHVGGELQTISLPNTVDHCADGGNAGSVMTQPAVWINPADASTWVFIAYRKGIAAYRAAVDANGIPSLSLQWSSLNGGTSPVIANGTVYYAASHAVWALDAPSGHVIWSDSQIGDIHWQSPIVVNGRLYLIDETSSLWVYQLDGVFRSGFE